MFVELPNSPRWSATTIIVNPKSVKMNIVNYFRCSSSVSTNPVNLSRAVTSLFKNQVHRLLAPPCREHSAARLEQGEKIDSL